MKKIIALATVITVAGAALAAAGEGKPLKQVSWPFAGMSGRVDKEAAQRGFQVYKEVCSACHSLKRVAFRNLADLGFSDAEIKALASGYQVQDGPNDQGEMFERPGKPSDMFPSPFPNEKAAGAAYGGAAPPDLSLIVKAREGGADYVYSLLTGFTNPPNDVTVGEGLYYNPYFPSGQLRMPPPLADNRVTYMDGTPATLDQEARDVTIFLQWAAEPEMEARKSMGLKVMAYLLVLTVFLYYAKKRIWSRIEH